MFRLTGRKQWIVSMKLDPPNQNFEVNFVLDLADCKWGKVIQGRFEQKQVFRIRLEASKRDAIN